MGVLPSRTAPAGLGGRKVAICCHYNICCQSLVYASHHHNVLSCCSVLQPAADSTRHCVGDLLRPGSLRFDLESATLLQFITQSCLFSLILLSSVEKLHQTSPLLCKEEAIKGSFKQGLCRLLQAEPFLRHF